MMRYLLPVAAMLALAACAPRVPDSGAGVANPGAGVGFGDYDSYRAGREAELDGRFGGQAVPPPVSVDGAPLDGTGQSSGDPVRDAAEAALARADRAAANSGVAPVEASPGNAPPPVVTNAVGISDENDFDAVSDQRDIQADAALIAQNRARYQVITPTALPTREGTDHPNVVQYALQTTNPVGAPLYRRFGINAEARQQRACAEFTSADLAQEAFLANGGPERDRRGLDPDGDGFACDWDPAPFRAVRGG